MTLPNSQCKPMRGEGLVPGILTRTEAAHNCNCRICPFHHFSMFGRLSCTVSANSTTELPRPGLPPSTVSHVPKVLVVKQRTENVNDTRPFCGQELQTANVFPTDLKWHNAAKTGFATVCCLKDNVFPVLRGMACNRTDVISEIVPGQPKSGPHRHLNYVPSSKKI